MPRRVLMVITILLVYLTTGGQKRVAFDSSKVEVRMFNTAKIKAFKENRDFQYDRSLEPATSLWDRFWNWFWLKVGELLNTKSGQRTFSILLILLAVAVIVFAVMKFTGMSSVGLFGSKNKAESLPYNTMDEDIHAISFEEAIEKAVMDGNLRLAVRLLYLQSLKKLSDKALINWQINKTNIAYVQELGGTAYQQSFNQLTLDFEKNWYGDRHIEPGEFQQVRDQFKIFNQQLH